MTPKKVLLQWVDYFNAADVDALASLYHEDAVNHQLAYEPIHGKAAISAMFANEFAKAKMVCIIDSIYEDGDWVILEWKDPLGLRGCGFFNITDGQIKRQRGYWDQLSFLKQHGLELPPDWNK